MPDGGIAQPPTLMRCTLEGEARAKPSHVIVVGNEKGGAGKSTVSMHLAIGLMKNGLDVGVIDLDVRQRTLTRYLENREKWSDNSGVKLCSPTISEVKPSLERDRIAAQDAERCDFHRCLAVLRQSCDIVLIDAPGSYTNLSRCAHSAADTIITPMNDSFIDFDLLADFDMQTMKSAHPSLYSEMVWDCRKEKARNTARPIDWIVVRNRMSPLRNRNNVALANALDELSTRINFRLATGLSERVIFRELFIQGLTLLDLDQKESMAMNMSHVAARQELRDLVAGLQLPMLANIGMGF